MNGETIDPDGWRTMFPTLFGPSATGDAAELARSEAILEASLAVADRGEQVRSQVRGALIEEVTAQLLARRVGPDAVRRERRILFDGVRGRDPPVRRDGRARRRRRGVRLQVGCPRHQRRRPPPARRRADARRRRGRAAGASPWSCSTPGGRATSGSPGRPRRTTGPASSRSRRSTRSPRERRDRARARQLLRAVPGPLRRGRARRAASGRRSCFATRRTWPAYHSASRGFDRAWYAERGITWLVRAAEVAVVAPIAVGAELVGTTTGRRLAPRLGSPPDRVPRRRRRAGRVGPHRLGPARRPRHADPDPEGIRRRSSARRRRRFGLARVDLGEVPPEPARLDRHRPARRSSTRWITSTTRSTPTGSTRR